MAGTWRSQMLEWLVGGEAVCLDDWLVVRLAALVDRWWIGCLFGWREASCWVADW